MNAKGIYLFFIATLLALTGCKNAQTKHTEEGGDTIPLRYARNLTLIQHNGYVEAILRNPWDTTKVLNRYEIKEAKKKAAVFTSVHCALLKELGEEDAIAAVADSKYINLAFIQQGLKDGEIADIGNGMDPNIEKIIDLQPDALLVSPFENSGGYGRLERLGIPIIECADYMEVSPLARAEWIRFYGRLFGKAEEADSIFAKVEKDYLAQKKNVQRATNKPTVIVDQPYQGTWYVPGGQSTMGILFRDAGANYVFADRQESGGIPMSVEAVLEAGQQADIWLMKYNQSQPMTLAQLQQDNAAYAHFKAFQQQNVYGCNTAKTPFYEETPFHPERLLSNLIAILHPELGITSSHTYYQKLEAK